jgi:hypothetical protein
MNHTKQFIEDAIEGEWRSDEAVAKGAFEDGAFFGGNAHWKYPLHRMIKRVSVEVILLDPRAWQAVGKTRGWCLHLDHYGDGECKKCFGRVRGRSYIQWHQFIDHLAEGLSIEEALAKLS